MDASTAAAIAALVVAIVALLVAGAQAAQQYSQTGQLIRLCDSVVYGGLPGRGHRVWEWGQFRFRVIYWVPQLSLPRSIWPGNAPNIASFAEGRYGLSELALRNEIPTPIEIIPHIYSMEHEDLVQRTRRVKQDQGRFRKSKAGKDSGAASWVSFCDAVRPFCGVSIRYDMVEQDADRCPGDLPNVPMPISMRDVVAMGLMAGMEVTSASFVDQTLFMHGRSGSIVSSRHAILGPLLHFARRETQQKRSLQPQWLVSDNGHKVTWQWLTRLKGVTWVGDMVFGYRERRRVQKVDGVWRSITDRRTGDGYLAERDPDDSRANLRRDRARDHTRVNIVRREARSATSSRESSPHDHRRDARELHPVDDTGRPRRGVHDGQWTVIPPIGKPRNTQAPPRRPSPSHNPREPEKRFIRVSTNQTNHDAENAPAALLEPPPVIHDPEMDERIKLARERQAERRAKAVKVEEDMASTEKLAAKGVVASPYDGGRLLLTWRKDDESEKASVHSEHTPEGPTQEELEAQDRETERIRQRRERDEDRKRRNIAQGSAVDFGRVDLFWIAQTSVTSGFWATPWKTRVPDQNTLVGGIAVMLEALLGFLDETSICYHWLYWQRPDLRETYAFLTSEHATWPAYAYNARGGVIPSGTYQLVHVSAFEHPIPTLELLKSYDWQVETAPHSLTDYHGEDLNLELSRLDGWLSYVGRMKEISDGRNDLLKQTAALVKMIIDEFELDFLWIERSANEGGLQDIQALTANVMDFLTDEQLSEAEQLYALVACLRTLKLAQLIESGPDTDAVEEILTKDIPVHMV